MYWILMIICLVSWYSYPRLCYSQDSKSTAELSQSPAPEGWVHYGIQSTNSPDLRCAAHSLREWDVTHDGEKVVISLDTRGAHQAPLPPGIESREVALGNKGRRCVMQVEDGWLVGMDIGEFGGGLWWFSSDGQSKDKLSEENIRAIVRSSGGILALAGLSHMRIDEGRLLRIADGNAGKRQAMVLADLGAAPKAFVVESSDSLLIMTNWGLVRTGSRGVVTPLFETDYKSLYANSMALLPSGVIYVGMRHFITRLTPAENGYVEEWFVPSNCSKFKLKGFDCACISEK